MFGRLVQRYDAVPIPKLVVAGVGILYFGFFSSWYVDDWVDRYINQEKLKASQQKLIRQKLKASQQKKKALKDTSGRRD